MVEDEQHQALAERFDGLRPHLQEVAYRMLGSDSDALDAVQESWLRLSSAGSVPLGDLRGWLTVVVGRTCLDLLCQRQARSGDSVGDRLPELLIDEDTVSDETATLADAVETALLVELETLTPVGRLAFVLREVFDVSVDEIAEIVSRSPGEVRQIACRATRQIRQHGPPTADADPQQHRSSC